MSRYLLLPLTLLLVGSTASAQEAADAPSVKAIAPFLDDRTVAVMHIKPSKLDVDKFLDRVGLVANLKVSELAPAKALLTAFKDAMSKAGSDDIFVAFSLIDLLEGPFFVIPVAKDGSTRALETIIKENAAPVEWTSIGDALVVGRKQALDRLKTLKPTSRPELAKALAAAGPNAVVSVALVPNDVTRRVLEETMPALPAELGGGSVKVFTKGLQWATFSVDATPEMKLGVVVQSPDAESATALGESLDRLTRNLFGLAVKDKFGKEPTLKEVEDLYQKLVKDPGADVDLGLVAKLVSFSKLKVEGSQLTRTLTDKELIETAAPMIVRTRAAAGRAQSSNNLKQIALAMYGYYDANKHFPASASYRNDKDKTPLLSWRVHILPFIEQDKLYKQFHLDEPWDSEHNKTLIPLMPKIYYSTTDKKLTDAGKTTYLVPRGESTIFPGETGIKITDITDGTSNTILVVDADDSKAVVWTKPEDLPIDLKNAKAGLSKRWGDGYLFAFADGSVHLLPAKMSAENLAPFFTRNSGIVRNYEK